MLHEKSFKCSSKVNDFTSQRVRGNKIPPSPPLNEALLAACIRVSLYVCVKFPILTSKFVLFQLQIQMLSVNILCCVEDKKQS